MRIGKKTQRNIRNFESLECDSAEIDGFLEASSLREFHCNAMVSVPLRLLEYHQRFMCLATNNMSRIDEAFKSRISVDVKYRDLDKKARRQAWGSWRES